MSTIRPDLHRQRGFGYIAAIFILVMLAGLGAAITSVSTTQQLGSALDVQGARAYQAARSGIQWGVLKALKTTICNSGTVTTPVTNDIGPLDGMAVTVQCVNIFPPNATNDTVEAGLGTIYRITATACNMPKTTGDCPGDDTGRANVNYVERRIEAVAEAAAP